MGWIIGCDQRNLEVHAGESLISQAERLLWGAARMEPITHFLTGACIGRAGLNRKTAYATLAATLAAEAADLDIFSGFAGPVEELKHHRGITHTFLGVPFVAAAATGAIWLFHRWWESRRRRQA